MAKMTFLEMCENAGRVECTAGHDVDVAYAARSKARDIRAVCEYDEPNLPSLQDGADAFVRGYIRALKAAHAAAFVQTPAQIEADAQK